MALPAGIFPLPEGSAHADLGRTAGRTRPDDDPNADTLSGLSPFEPVAVEEALDRTCAESGTNRRRTFMTTRIAIVGGPVSPPLHETIAALGRDRTVARLRAARDVLATAHVPEPGS